MEEEYDYIKKELFLDDPLASKAAQKLIDDWKKQLSGDKQLLGDELHDKYDILTQVKFESVVVKVGEFPTSDFDLPTSNFLTLNFLTLYNF